jgi:hypothetical protein
MKKLVLLLLLITMCSCELKRTNERNFHYSGDLIDVKVDDDGEWHFVSSEFGTYTDINDMYVNVKRKGTEMILQVHFYDYDENPNGPYRLDPFNSSDLAKGKAYHIIVPKNYKIEIFND